MIKSVVFVSLGNGSILVQEKKIKENSLDLESQNVDDKSKY